MPRKSTNLKPQTSPKKVGGKVLKPKTAEQKQIDSVFADFKASFISWQKSPALHTVAIIAITSLLVIGGLIMVLSSSSVTHIAQGRSAFSGFSSQLTYAVVGAVLAVIVAMIPIKFFANMKIAHLILLTALALQSLVLVPGIGSERGGNRNWISIGPLTGQPSEFLKLALALWLGAFLARNRDRLRQFSVFLIALAAIGLSLAAILLGRDLGTTLILVLLSGGALWVAGLPKKFFGMILAGGLMLAIVGVLSSPNRLARIENWLSGQCLGDACWQPQNGLRALAEGGLTGVGIGSSRQKWGRLPAADNDYIFAIIGEELGLVGTLAVVFLFLILAFVLYQMIKSLDDPFAQITTAGISLWLMGQAFINMAVVVGLLPVLGVPLPLVSAGGSALVASLIAVGLLVSFALSEPGAKEAFGAKNHRAKRTSSVVAPVKRAKISSKPNG